jgi:hypothetical protein
MTRKRRLQNCCTCPTGGSGSERAEGPPGERESNHAPLPVWRSGSCVGVAAASVRGELDLHGMWEEVRRRGHGEAKQAGEKEPPLAISARNKKWTCIYGVCIMAA